MRKLIAVAVVVAALVGCIGVACAASKQDEAKAMVKKAVAYIKENGNEKSFAELSNPTGKFVKGDLYIFVFDPKGVTLAHGGNQKLVGKNMYDLKDSAGTYFVKDILATAKKGGGWAPEYKWTNPVSKKIEPKVSYVEPVGDLAVGCGIYK